MTALRRSELDPEPLRQLERWRADAAEAGVDTERRRPGDRLARWAAVRTDGAREGRSRTARCASSPTTRAARRPSSPRTRSPRCSFTGRGARPGSRAAVARLSGPESDAYFDGRPPGSRLSAAVSPQSRPVASRAELEAAVERLRGAVSRRRRAPPGHLGRIPAPAARLRVLAARPPTACTTASAIRAPTAPGRSSGSGPEAPRALLASESRGASGQGRSRAGSRAAAGTRAPPTGRRGRAPDRGRSPRRPAARARSATPRRRRRRAAGPGMLEVGQLEDRLRQVADVARGSAAHR